MKNQTISNYCGGYSKYGKESTMKQDNATLIDHKSDLLDNQNTTNITDCKADNIEKRKNPWWRFSKSGC
jgi:hypothetical protein